MAVWEAELGSQNILLSPIDSRLRDKIGEYGNTHPFILVLAGSEPAEFLVCETQEFLEQFVGRLQLGPDLGEHTLLRGVERALCGEVYEAADVWFHWSQQSGPTVERVYLGLPEDLECPAYFGYPAFGLGQPNLHRRAAPGSARRHL